MHLSICMLCSTSYFSVKYCKNNFLDFKKTKPILTQEVMGSDGRVSGGGGGAYRLVKSRSLNFFPISDRVLSTCCCVPSKTKFKVLPGSNQHDYEQLNLMCLWNESPLPPLQRRLGDVRIHCSKLTLYVTDLELLCIRQGRDVYLCTRVLLKETHISALLPDQPSYKVLVQEHRQKGR